MSTISLSEIVKEAQRLRKKEEKVAWLQNNKSRPLCDILKIMYDPRLKLNIPAEKPPFRASEHNESHGMLYREARKLVYFVEGFEGDNLPAARREFLFIEMLEMIHRDDAELLLQMITQKPLKGLTPEVINEAYGLDVPTKSEKSKKT